MTETAEPIKIYRGLKGVYFDRSDCTFIDGKAGELRYRGYSIHDLAEQSTFEETAYLLLHGDLPTRPELKHFDACAVFHAASREDLPAEHERLPFERVRGGLDLSKRRSRRAALLGIEGLA